MTSNFYTQVATCVAQHPMTEAFVLVGKNHMTALGDGHLAAVIADLEEDKFQASERIARDYHMLPRQCAQAMFTNNAKGFVSIDGVLVSFSVAKLSDDHWRVHFTRVDAAALYTITQERLANLEKDVSALLKVAKLNGGQ